MQNVDLKSVSELLGHTTTRMTERYTHASPGHLHAMVQRISRGATGTTTDTGLTENGVAIAKYLKNKRPRRDLNPCYRRERPVS